MVKRLKKYPDKKPYSFRLSESLMNDIKIYCDYKNINTPDLIANLLENEIKGLTLERKYSNTGILIMLPVFTDVGKFIKNKTELLIYSYHDINKLKSENDKNPSKENTNKEYINKEDINKENTNKEYINKEDVNKESIIKLIDTREKRKDIDLLEGSYYFNKLIRINNKLDMLDKGTYKKHESAKIKNTTNMPKSINKTEKLIKHEGLTILRSWLINYFINYTYFTNEEGFEEITKINLISKNEAKRLAKIANNKELLDKINSLKPSHKKFIKEETDLNELVNQEMEKILKNQ